LGQVNINDFTLGSVPAVADRCNASIKILLSILEHSIKFDLALGVDLSLMRKWDFNISDQADPDRDTFLAHNCVGRRAPWAL